MKASKKNKPQPRNRTHMIALVGYTVIGLGILGAIFALGWHYGSTNQINKDKKTIAAAKATAQSRAVAGGESVAINRHVFVGDVTKVSAKQITVKTTTNDTQTATIDDKTVITSAKDPKATASDIKVGSHIFVTCTQNSDKSLTAQRILIIH